MTNVFSFGISNDARKSKDKAMELASIFELNTHFR